MTIARNPLQTKIRNTILWLAGCTLAGGVSVALAGYIGFSQSLRIMAAPAPGATVASAVPLTPPVHDPHKPTVAVLLGNTVSEPTDVLGPYTMFAESGKYNVYTVAASRMVRTLTGGLDLVPHLSFEELAARLHGDPDIVVVPQIADIRASINTPVVAWVRQQARGHALLFSWCTGAEVLAESGALDGKSATAHWGDIDRLQRVYPQVHWERGIRYVDNGTILSTAGLTAGVDATLHLLRRRNGAELAARVAEALHLPASPFVDNPRCRQYELGLADSIFLLNTGFRWPKPRLSVWLYDGVRELDLGAALDVYGVSAAYQIHTRSTAASVLSSHGIQFVPRERVSTLPSTVPFESPSIPRDRVPGVILRSENSQEFAYITALKDLARHQDTWTAAFAAKRLEIRTPVRLEGDSAPIRVMLAPLFIGCAPLAFLFWSKRGVEKRQTGLQCKVPPVALGLAAAAMMWCAASAAPDFGFRFPSNPLFPLVLALIGAMTCLAAIVSFRRAKTTVNPMQPDSTSSLVVSGIYRYTRNPMYLGFLLILLAWAAVLTNLLALVWLPAFVLYMNRFQISPEERALACRFGPVYTEYRARVRRWL